MLPSDSENVALRPLLHLANERALFFTEAGIIIEQTSQIPYLPLLNTVEQLAFNIEASHLDKETLIVKGTTPLSANKLSSLGYQVCPLRAFLNQAISMQSKILRAYHWLNWDSHTRFCGRCGTPIKSVFNVLEKRCEKCDITLFPKASPAVMVLLHREQELLLARSPHFQPGVYSAVAGFVEIGESAEDAAAREVNEELGLKVTDLQYFSSQTWPFPDSFMVAFTSNAPEGNLIIDPIEIEDARWFSIKDLPALPSSASISRRLIDSVVSKLSR